MLFRSVNPTCLLFDRGVQFVREVLAHGDDLVVNLAIVFDALQSLNVEVRAVAVGVQSVREFVILGQAVLAENRAILGDVRQDLAAHRVTRPGARHEPTQGLAHRDVMQVILGEFVRVMPGDDLAPEAVGFGGQRKDRQLNRVVLVVRVL